MANHTLAQNLARLNKAREDIADAIVARGGSATHTDGLESMPTSIQAIPGSTDYEALENLPQINSVTLIGNKSLSDIGIVNPMVIKGRVDTVADLANVQNPQAGWVYFVGSSGASELAEYVYIENGNSGSWQFLGYNTIVIDTELSTTSENPVQNKVITNALNGKVNTETGKGLSTNDYTNAEKASVALSAGTLTPISESAYEALTTKDKPLYFIYD